MTNTQLLAGIEAGGTKVIALLGTGPDDIVAECRIHTTTPVETISAIADFFAEQAEAGNVPVAGGVGWFGSTELRSSSPSYGFVTATPKHGWSGIDVLGPISATLGVPVGFDTDVNVAALGERKWGAAQGLETFVYLTIGTGIGGGAVAGGEPIHGLIHSEMGHVAVPRHPDDDYEGLCPYHSDCFEGMASGPAMAGRWELSAQQLVGTKLAKAVEIEAWYIAAGLRSITYVLAPERIIIGGGVAQLPGLFPAVRLALSETMASYPGLVEHESADFVTPAALGEMAGPIGALELARLTLATKKSRRLNQSRRRN